MKTAKWSVIENGIASSYCGVGEPNGARGGGVRALSFAGDVQRYATIEPLDVSTGGWLEAELLIAPKGFEISHPFCKSAYSGVVYIQYSTGGNWTVMATYTPWENSQEKFFPVKLKLPPDAISTHTSFRFIQPFFDSARDSWALDNVKIFKYFKPDWDTNAEFVSNVAITKKKMAFAACCFDTERCERRLSEDEWAECNSIPGFSRGNYVLRGNELYILMVLLINIFKFVYVSVMNWLIYKTYPFAREYRALANIDFLMKYIPARYRPKKNLSNLINDIHMSARLVGAIRDELADKEEDIDREALRLKEVEKAERKKRKKEKFKRKKKIGYTDEEAALDSSDEEEENKNMIMATSQDIVITDDMEKLKRQNVAMLRIPFPIKSDQKWRQLFVLISCGVYFIIFISMAVIVPSYTVSQTITSFGSLKSEFIITSTAVGFFAFICKHIFFKNIHILIS